MMGDWLHCNSCFLQPGDGTKFNLTSCSHIYCEKCVEKGVCKEKCAMCGNSCSVIPLSGKMPPEIDMYFKNPSDFITDIAKKTLDMLKFQGDHRARFVSFLRHEIKKMRGEMNNVRQAFSKFQSLERELMQDKKECLVLKEEMSKARKEIVHLKEENTYLKKLLSEKGLGFPSPGAIRASPSGRNSSITSQTVSRGPSPLGMKVADNFNQSYLSKGGSPMDGNNIRSRGGTPGSRMYEVGQFLHQSSPSSESHNGQRVSSYITQQGFPISHPASHAQNAMPSVMITSGRLQVRTPPSGGKIGKIGATPPSSIQDTPRSAPQLISVAGYTPRIVKMHRNET